MIATPSDQVAQILAQAAHPVLNKAELDYRASIVSDTSDHAEFASNIALVGAGTTQQSPMELAETLAASLGRDEHIQSATAAAPGFINITLTPQTWREWYNRLQADSFTSHQGRGQRVSLEFLSANPTGPLVLTNAWQAYYGDILARIYTSQGFTVEREYLVNDAGTQVANLGKSIQASLGKKFDRDESEAFYKGDYVADLAKQLTMAYGNDQRVIEAEAYEVGHKAADILLDSIKATLMRMGVEYDSFFSDTQVDNQRTLTLLQEKHATTEYDGAIWLKREFSGTNKDEVLVRSEGRGATYFLNDISYQLNRLVDRGFDTVLSVVGPDHHGQAIRLSQALHALGYADFQMYSTQTVRLVQNGREVKMSKRAGNFIVLDDFLDEVPSDAARFLFASRDINSHLDFDLDVVRSQTQHNPLFYCMYAYVRAQSILQKAQAQKLTVGRQVDHELSESELLLVRQLEQLPGVITGIIASQRVHTLLHSFIELARRFHDYYEVERIIDIKDSALRASKLAFVARLVPVFETLFELVGVTPRESM